MKSTIQLISIFTLAAITTGCKTLDRITENAVNEVVRTTTEEVVGTTTAESLPPLSQSIEPEDIRLYDPVRTQRNYGRLSVTKLAKNPQSQTQAAIDLCTHPRIGGLRCGGYLYEVTAEGWLKDDKIKFDDLNNRVITIAAGKYYVKFHNWEGSKKYYATGELEIKPFVTNHINFEFE